MRLVYGLEGGAYGDGPIGVLYLGGLFVLDWKTLFGAPNTWGDRVDWWVKIGLLVVWCGWTAGLLWEGLAGGFGLVRIWGLILGWVVEDMRMGETVGE